MNTIELLFSSKDLEEMRQLAHIQATNDTADLIGDAIELGMKQTADL